MFGNLGNMANMMKMAKEMQANAKKAKEEMKNLEVTSSSSDGQIEVTVTGDFTVTRINIQPELLQSCDAETLADLITVTTNNALNEAKDKAQEQISQLTGGMNIPGLFN